MGKAEMTAVQFKLSETNVEKIIVYLVPRGAIIFPSHTGEGIVQGEFFADKIIGEKIRGLTGFRARGAVSLYYDGRYWGLSTGALFGAYPNNLHKRTINK